MYHVVVIYADHSFREYDHINRIEFYEASAYKVLEGAEIISHHYELGNTIYHFFSEDSVASVFVGNAISIEIYMEH